MFKILGESCSSILTDKSTQENTICSNGHTSDSVVVILLNKEIIKILDPVLALTFKQKLNKNWNNIWKEMQQNFGPKKRKGFLTQILLMWSSQ